MCAVLTGNLETGIERSDTSSVNFVDSFPSRGSLGLEDIVSNIGEYKWEESGPKHRKKL